jgi:hypothetical protein
MLEYIWNIYRITHRNLTHSMLVYRGDAYFFNYYFEDFVYVCVRGCGCISMRADIFSFIHVYISHFIYFLSFVAE